MEIVSLSVVVAVDEADVDIVDVMELLALEV